MAEPISPNRLQPDTPLKDNLAYINDNMDKTVSAINDVMGTLRLLWDGGLISEQEVSELADKWATEIIAKHVEVLE